MKSQKAGNIAHEAYFVPDEDASQIRSSTQFTLTAFKQHASSAGNGMWVDNLPDHCPEGLPKRTLIRRGESAQFLEDKGWVDGGEDGFEHRCTSPTEREEDCRLVIAMMRRSGRG